MFISLQCNEPYYTGNVKNCGKYIAYIIESI